jgi:hypothetical protein
LEKIESFEKVELTVPVAKKTQKETKLEDLTEEQKEKL